MKLIGSVLLATLLAVAISGANANCSLCGASAIPEDGLLRERHGIKCSELFEEITFMESGSDECSIIQLTAYQAGCCSKEYVPEEVCSVCPDGSSYSATVEIPGSTTRRTLTCADLTTEGSFLNFLTTPGDCSDTFLQRSAAWCGCEGTEVECNLCPGGAPPPDYSKTEKVLYGWNCSNFEYVYALLSKVECSLSAEIMEFDAAAFCCEGLDPPDLCPLCPSGQVVTDPDKVVVTEYGLLQCGDIEESLRMIPTESTCALVSEKFESSFCCSFPDDGTPSQLWRSPLLVVSAFILALWSMR